jgi:ABC-type nitrate/sulfonate/bicarbonate transport system permease component
MIERRRFPLARLTSGLPPARGLLPLILGLALWQAFGPRQSPYAPLPSAWWDSVRTMLHNGKLMPALGSTLVTFALAIVIAALVGGALGLLIGRSRTARRALGPLLEFCRGLPPPVIVPVAVLLLGYAESLKLLVVAWVAIWPILLNTASAASLLDELMLDIARTFRLDRITTLRKIIVPAVVPDFLLGLRVAVPLGIIITLLVEMLTSLPGIGSLIVISQRQFRSADVYGLLVVVGLMGFLINSLFAMAEQLLLRRWPPRAPSTR